MNAPERSEKERIFAQEHKDWKDIDLYQYLRNQLKTFGKGATAERIIGSTYLVERLGPWPEIRTRALREDPLAPLPEKKCRRPMPTPEEERRIADMTEVEMIARLWELYGEFGRPPTRRDVPGSHLYRERLGRTWKDVLRTAGLYGPKAEREPAGSGEKAAFAPPAADERCEFYEQ
jgi:hypothetical protein